jgi:hypothetical protein
MEVAHVPHSATLKCVERQPGSLEASLLWTSVMISQSRAEEKRQQKLIMKVVGLGSSYRLVRGPPVGGPCRYPRQPCSSERRISRAKSSMQPGEVLRAAEDQRLWLTSTPGERD